VIHRELSEIEGCVLAVAWAEGPSTPYAIRRVFLDSPSPQWSGSAGTIYPLVKRLKQRRLIRSETRSIGKRRGSYISVTPAGLRALQRWLSASAHDFVVGVPPDPLRTRVRFFGALAPDAQRELVVKAYRQASNHLHLVEQDCRRHPPGTFEFLTARGALLSMRSRCAFLEEVADALNVRLPKDDVSLKRRLGA
jgi:DNA-binding PadR family transcriptional regulator